MEKIYSKVDPELITHMVIRSHQIDAGRADLVDSKQSLQCSALNMTEGQTFKPHKHIFRPLLMENYITQEAWVIVRGMVMVKMYDIDDSELEWFILHEGDCVITLRGGHNYICLQHNTLVYEFKTGPYLGQELDKEFINV